MSVVGNLMVAAELLRLASDLVDKAEASGEVAPDEIETKRQDVLSTIDRVKTRADCIRESDGGD